MWKKEFKYTIRKAILTAMFPLVVPIMAMLAPGILNDRKTLYDIFTFTWWVVLILAAVTIPGTSFQQERKERAWEYLLSTPVKRSRILVYKIVPRFLVFLLFQLLALVFFHFTTLFKVNLLYQPIGLILLPLLLFVISFSFSIFEMRDLIALLAFLLYLSSMLFADFIRKTFYIKAAGSHFNPFAVAWFISLSLFAILSLTGFFAVYSRFDLKPEAVHRKKFMLITGIPIVLLALISLTF